MCIRDRCCCSYLQLWYMHTFTCEPLISRKMDCGDQSRYYHSPTIIVSQIYIVQFFPTTLLQVWIQLRKWYFTQCLIKSLLRNEMLYNSWVHVLHITYFWSPTIYWKPWVTNHFDLFVINEDDNQHVFQSCIGLVNMEPFMANTMSTDTILKQFLTSLLLFLTSNIIIIVDVRHGTWITTNLSSYATL